MERGGARWKTGETNKRQRTAGGSLSLEEMVVGSVEVAVEKKWR